MEQAHYEVDEKNRYRVETPGHQGWPRTARPGDPNKYLMVSADCHANEPGSLWRDRIDSKFRDRLPHVEVDAKGEKWFIAEGVGKSRVRARMIGDVPRENSEDRLRGRVGADPKERIQDQIRDGIDAEIIFPNKGLMMFATKDAAFGMAQCRVWNDFAWEMYGEYNDFMSPAAAIMTSEVELAIEEIKRVAKIGFRFLTLPCKPVFGGHDSRDPNYNLTVYDPMWAAIEDCDLPITFHVSTGRDPRVARKEGGAVINYVSHSLSPTIEPVASLCGSGVLERFPKIRFAAVESGIGWVRGRSTRWTRRIASIICGRIRSSSSCPANISAATARRRFRKIAPGWSSRRNGSWSTTSCGPMTIRTPKEPGRILRRRSSARWVI